LSSSAMANEEEDDDDDDDEENAEEPNWSRTCRKGPKEFLLRELVGEGDGRTEKEVELPKRKKAVMDRREDRRNNHRCGTITAAMVQKLKVCVISCRRLACRMSHTAPQHLWDHLPFFSASGLQATTLVVETRFVY
jgi:hypothetical protein